MIRFLGIALLLFASPLLAEALTWEAVVQEASGKNPDIAVSRAALKNAEAQSGASYSGFLPSLSGSIGYTENSTGSVTTSTPGAPFVTGGSGGSRANYTAGINATQNIFNGFGDYGKVRQGSAALEAARAALAATKATVSASLKSAFAQALYAQKNVELAEAILKRQQANLRMVTLRFEGGAENKGNQLYQEATVSQAKYQYDHAVRGVDVAARQLASLLGRPDANGLTVTGELGAHAPAEKPNFRALADTNPNHVQAHQQARAADYGVTVADAGWFPALNLTGFYGENGPAFPPDTNRWSVGATLTIPLFNGTSQIYAAEGARAQRLQAQASEDSTDAKLISTLASAYSALLDAIQQLRVAEDFKKGAEARSVIASEKYNTGLMTFEDWSVIENDRVTREQNLLQQQLGAVQAEANWESAQGTGAIP